MNHSLIDIEQIKREGRFRKTRYYFDRDSRWAEVMGQAIQAAHVELQLAATPVEPEDVKLKIPFQEVAYFEVDRGGFFETVIDAVLATLTAENNIGRVLQEAKNVISYYVPIFEPIDQFTDEITDIINHMSSPESESLMDKISNQKNNTMKKIKNWFLQRVQEKSFWQGLIGILTAAGIAISPQLATGIIMTGVGLAGFVDIISRTEFRKTIRGVIAILTALGVAIRPDLKEIIITIGLALFGVASGFWKGQKKKKETA